MKSTLSFIFILFTFLFFSKSNAQEEFPQIVEFKLIGGKKFLGATIYPIPETETIKVYDLESKKEITVKKEDIKSAKLEFSYLMGVPTSIKAYKNAGNKKIANDPVKVLQVFTSPTISLYKSDVTQTVVVKGAGGLNNVPMDDTFWYCLRPGEEVASIVSWTFINGANKNSIFRKNATEYFKDYPELVKKIDNRELKYDDIFEVVQMYNDWKSEK